MAKKTKTEKRTTKRVKKAATKVPAATTASPAAASVRSGTKYAGLIGCQAAKPLFTLGRVVATPGALAAFEKSGQQPGEFLERHVSGDWGDVDAEDARENELSLKNGWRLLSAYTLEERNQNLGDYRSGQKSPPFVLLKMPDVVPA